MGFMSRLKESGLGLIGMAQAPVRTGVSGSAPLHYGTPPEESSGEAGSARIESSVPIEELTERLHTADHERLQTAFELARRGKDADGVFRVRDGAGWIALKFGPLRDDSGALCGVKLSGHPVVPRQAMSAPSAADPVSGLGYWVSAAAQLEPCWQLARQHRAPVSVVVIEIEDYAGLQSRSGRPAAARAVAICGQVAIRAAGQGGLALRYGPATFVMVLPNCSVTVAKAAAARFAAEALLRIGEDDRATSFDVAVGGATVDALGAGADEALEGALAALSGAQQRDRNRAMFVDLRQVGPGQRIAA